MKSFIFAKTSQGLPVLGYRFGSPGPHVLILGGVHGDEWEGVAAAEGLLGKFYEAFTYRLQLTIVPQLNRDGVLRNTRQNGRAVDLNRNLPTQDWTSEVSNSRYAPGPSANSEPENQALVHWLDEHRPRLVISFHSWKPLLNVNGRCLPEAQIISRITGYEIQDSIGYPTPGCLGTYCGLERDMPTLTYEVERNLAPDQILTVHVPAVLEALKTTETRF